MPEDTQQADSTHSKPIVRPSKAYRVIVLCYGLALLGLALAPIWLRMSTYRFNLRNGSCFSWFYATAWGRPLVTYWDDFGNFHYYQYRQILEEGAGGGPTHFYASLVLSFGTMLGLATLWLIGASLLGRAIPLRITAFCGLLAFAYFFLRALASGTAPKVPTHCNWGITALALWSLILLSHATIIARRARLRHARE